MKTTRILFVFLSIIGCLSFVLGAKKYSTKFDNLDIDAIIKNERLLKNYIGCLLDRNSCTADASEMKKNLPDALASNCADCTDGQKRMSDRLSHHLIDHRPEDWRQLEEKYDPTGDYRQRYLREQQYKNNNATTNDLQDEITESTTT